MRTDNFNSATVIGVLIKDRIFNAEWKLDKEIATIAEKAVSFYKIIKCKTIEECLDIKIREMENGYLLAREHGFDDFTRGIIAGTKIGSYVVNSNNEKLDEIETIWSANYNNYINADYKEDVYLSIISDVTKKHLYKDNGYITVQELTKKLLSMMDEGYKDKYVVLNNINVDKVNGNYSTEIADEVQLSDGLNKDDLIMIW